MSIFLPSENNPAKISLMILISAELRLFSAFGIKHIYQSSNIQRKQKILGRNNGSEQLLSFALQELSLGPLSV